MTPGHRPTVTYMCCLSSRLRSAMGACSYLLNSQRSSWVILVGSGQAIQPYLIGQETALAAALNVSQVYPVHLLIHLSDLLLKC